MHKTIPMQEAEERWGQPIETVMADYIKARIPRRQAAKLLGVSLSTLRNWEQKLNPVIVDVTFLEHSR